MPRIITLDKGVIERMEIIKNLSDPAQLLVHYTLSDAQGGHRVSGIVSPDALTPAQQTVLEAIWTKGTQFVETREGIDIP